VFSTLFGDAKAMNTDKMILKSFTMLNPDYSLQYFLEKDYIPLREVCALITLYRDSKDMALWFSEIFNGYKSLGRGEEPLMRNNRFIDIDIIDTTGLQDNMHALRHSYFELNRFMVDDLREIIVQGRRACKRQSRLLQKHGNTYFFLYTPTWVKNK